MISKRVIAKLAKGSAIRTAFDEACRLRSVYGADQVFDLSIGNPAAPPPRMVHEAAQALLEDDSLTHSYMCEAGYESVRAQIAASLNKRFDAACSQEHLVMSVGAAGGLNTALCSLLDPGDGVIVFLPFYPGYRNFIENWGGNLIGVPPQGADFQPDFDALERCITADVKAVIVNSPHNPTGTIYTMETAQRIADLLVQKQAQFGHEIYLLSDEPYRELVYNQSSPIWWPHIYKNTMVIYSFSKSLSLPGERIGYVMVSPTMTEASQVVRAVRLSTGMLGYVNAPAFFQKIIAACLNEHIALDYYERNRELLYTKLLELGFEAVEPKGAFYIFVKSPFPDEAEFLKLAHQRNLIFVGGSAFGWGGYVRLSFCGPYDSIKRALPALAQLAADCGLNGKGNKTRE